MKNWAGIRKSLMVGVAALAIALPLQAATLIFDNSVNDLSHRFEPGTLEVGDQIVFEGTERYLTEFSFEYWGVNTDHSLTFEGDVQARVRFYVNNGPLFNGYATPNATPFYDSSWFSVPSPTERSTFIFLQGTGYDFPDGGLFLPADEITWSVQFQGMEGTDAVGIDIYNPPDVGQDYPDYWQYSGGSWSLMTNSVPMDFAARMYANAQIPEPSSLAFSILGGLGLLAFARRLRRQ